MAKVGLNFGEKMQIADKTYRVLNDGLVDLKEIFGDLSFRSFEESDLIYADDMKQPRRPDGTYPQIPTGESRGLVVGIFSSIQGQTEFFTLVDMTLADFEGLQLKYRDPVELEDIVVTYSSVGSNQFKLFASKIKKKGASGSVKENNQSQQPKKD
ncbi:TPA: conjugal transfer protein [Streptococcus agalactiae]|nr:conjugal transfer protein [Streptococcus agalactiae]HEN3089770.1 conjugal transfer protein [Streptococcus agalactiae]